MQERAVETQVCSLCHNPVPDATAVAEPQLAVSTIGAADASNGVNGSDLIVDNGIARIGVVVGTGLM